MRNSTRRWDTGGQRHMNSHEPVMNRGLRKTKSCHMSGALIIFRLFDLCTTVGEIGACLKIRVPTFILMRIWLISNYHDHLSLIIRPSRPRLGSGLSPWKQGTGHACIVSTWVQSRVHISRIEASMSVWSSQLWTVGSLNLWRHVRFPAGPYHRYSAGFVRMQGISSKSRMLDSSWDIGRHNIIYIFYVIYSISIII